MKSPIMRSNIMISFITKSLIMRSDIMKSRNGHNYRKHTKLCTCLRSKSPLFFPCGVACEAHFVSFTAELNFRINLN